MRPPWLSHPVVLAAVVINVFLLAVALRAAASGGGALDRLLVEDGLVEWLQFLCFSSLAIVLALVAADRWVRGAGMRLHALVLAGLAALVALAALEEISWFQRVLQVETPEFFRQHNRQGETNLHNLALGESSVNKRVLVKLMFLAGITHNLVLPLLALRLPRIRVLVESFGLYLPPLGAAISYLVLVLLSQVLFDHGRRGELGELFGAVHYLGTVFAAYAVGVGYQRQPVFQARPEQARVSVMFAVLMAYLLFVAWLLSAMSLAGRT